MKKKVYEYIKKHGTVNTEQIIADLDIQGLEALKIVTDLREKGFVRSLPPMQLDTNQDNSCYYTVTEKPFTEE